MVIIILVIILFLWIIIGNLMQKPGNTFDMYIGVPGSGKTTFAAYLTKKRRKMGKKNPKLGVVHSNVPIKGAYKVEKSDIGKYLLKDTLLLMDEAGIDYNNRNFKKFSDDETYFYKFHRHYNVDIALFSQDFDVDVKLRKLATRLYIVSKSIFPGFVKRKLITKKIGIDNNTKQLIDQYSFAFLGVKYIYCPKLWKMFDSYSYKELPTKEWEGY